MMRAEVLTNMFSSTCQVCNTIQLWEQLACPAARVGQGLQEEGEPEAGKDSEHLATPDVVEAEFTVNGPQGDYQVGQHTQTGCLGQHLKTKRPCPLLLRNVPGNNEMQELCPLLQTAGAKGPAPRMLRGPSNPACSRHEQGPAGLTWKRVALVAPAEV